MIARLLPTRPLLLTCAFAFVVGTCALANGQLISSFQSAFQLTTPPSGWEYLWNSGGAMGNPANYTALLPNSSGNYTSGGTDTFPAPAPAANVNFALVDGMPGGHPGLGASQGGADGIERYAIAAYMLPAGSLVSIQNSNVVTTNPNSGGSKDGLNVRVFVGNSAIAAISSSSGAGVGSSVTFNGFLGNLSAGDKIYVAVGSKGDDLFDSFQLRYDIVAVPEPSSAILVGIGLLMLSGSSERRRYSRLHGLA
jgi:hypothetical protein